MYLNTAHALATILFPFSIASELSDSALPNHCMSQLISNEQCASLTL